MNLTKHPAGLILTAALLAATTLSGCAPLVLGGAVGGAFMVTDRRTSGAQVEDQGIELKAASRVREAMGERGHVNVTSYNRVALITGEVPSEADKLTVEQVVARTENVRSVVNELALMGNASMASRGSDIIVQAKVKATFVDARDLQANAFKVVVERGEVYLMGLVTEREATRAAELASTVSGVQKVIKVLHIISEEELARKQPAAPASSPK
ncbi:MAG TPA: BON domain-containing protein [Aquabacterium sp.]|uniref:BON domain-containing protein n=1 Tax=Aquabacterium sp. TaxID=1872578 RepID=UPI002E38008C|nr:BON domain-containing protein [Aquabacterium sp.]HEX5371525.1 BON domain-containing protein [Aquabacterium sp.]